MDTPGLFDTDQSHEEMGVLLIKAVINMHPGFHAALYVIRYGARYTKEEYPAYQRFKLLFGSDVTGHMIVVFTGGDALKAGEDLGQKLLKAPKELRAVMDDCNRRYVVFNNMAVSGEEQGTQVAQLLQRVRELSSVNRERTYVVSNYSQLGEAIEEEVGKRMREVEAREVQVTRYAQDLQRRADEQQEQQAQGNVEHQQQLAAASEHLQAKVTRMTDAITVNVQLLRAQSERKNRELQARIAAQQEANAKAKTRKRARTCLSVMASIVGVVVCCVMLF